MGNETLIEKIIQIIKPESLSKEQKQDYANYIFRLAKWCDDKDLLYSFPSDGVSNELRQAANYILTL